METFLSNRRAPGLGALLWMQENAVLTNKKLEKVKVKNK